MGNRIDPIWVRRAGRFGIAGLLVTGLHSIIAAGLIESVLPRPALANGIAFVTSTACSYLLNTYWSFSRTPAPANLLRFMTVALLGLCITMVVAGLAAAYGLHYLLGIACVVAVVPPITFLLHNYWTYR